MMHRPVITDTTPIGSRAKVWIETSAHEAEPATERRAEHDQQKDVAG
ncbi:hypothetical protein [Tardiphaga sp.]